MLFLLVAIDDVTCALFRSTTSSRKCLYLIYNSNGDVDFIEPMVRGITMKSFRKQHNYFKGL